jgi:hypothetical protein
MISDWKCRYAEAPRLTPWSFANDITAKRLGVFASALVSQVPGVSLVPRLRLLNEDARR